MTGRHPWEILPDLVGAEILTRDEARGMVLAHEDANRRALQEIHALLPELLATDLIDPKGAQKIQHVVVGVTRNAMPDL